MRFRELRLSAYGSFTDELLDFGEPESCDLHILLGPNEAGKSTTLRAIDALLFGFPSQTTDAHTHPYDRLRVGALLEDSDGAAIELTRVKRRQSSLRDGDDEPVEESVLREMLGGTEPAAYRRLFLIDQDQLRVGGQGLLDGGGELGISLFGATLGTGNLAGIVTELKEAHEGLFSIDAKARKPPLNAALRAYREHSEQARKLAVRPREYDQARRDAKRLAEERAASETRLAEQERNLRRLERLKSVAGLLAHRRSMLAELTDLHGVPELEPDTPQQRKLLTERLASAEQRLKRTKENLDRQAQEIQGLTVPQDLLVHADAIRAIADQANTHESALRERPAQTSERDALRDAQQAALKALAQPAAVLAAVDGQSREEIETLGEQYVSLSEQQRASRQRFEQVKKACERAELALAQKQQPPEQPSELARWLEATSASLSSASAAETQLARIERDLAALRRRAEDLNPPARLDETQPDPPSAATISSYLKEFQALDHTEHKLALQLEQLAERSAELQRQHGALGGDRAQALAGQLADARSDRDQVLTTLETALSKGELARASEQATRLRTLIVRADSHADLAREQADTLARNSQTSGELVVLSKQLEQVEHKLAANAKHHEDLAERWTTEWSACGLSPSTPAAMLTWRERYEQLTTSQLELTADREREKKITTDAEKTRLELQAACRAAGAPAAKNLPLAALCTHAREALEQIQARIETDAGLRRAAAEALKAQEEALAHNQACDQALEAWQTSWAQALHPLGLSGQLTPAQARAQIAALTDIHAKRLAVEELERQIERVENSYAAFGEATAELCSGLAPDLSGREPVDAARELRGRLEAALADHAKLAQLQLAKQAEQQTARELEDELTQARSQLHSLLSQAKCTTIEQLVPVEEQSARRAALSQELAALEQRITEQGEQQAPELEEALNGRTSDELTAEHASLEYMLLEVRQECDELISAHAQASQRLLQLDHGTQAAGEAEHAEQHAALATSLLNRYLAERGAAILLRRAIDLHRERNTHPVLERAQELLGAFTDGALTRLLVHETAAGRPVILARRANGAELDVDSMSSGTRDQLYLALRLAALEHHLASRSALPLLLDDILVNSDETRTGSSLPVLAELAARTQVIMFTHHQHVAEIACERLGDSVRIHRLQGESGLLSDLASLGAPLASSGGSKMG
ncbi:MAG TPA: AAA family ATPase [Solirubrobacteraceae bacterium]